MFITHLKGQFIHLIYTAVMSCRKYIDINIASKKEEKKKSKPIIKNINLKFCTK